MSQLDRIEQQLLYVARAEAFAATDSHSYLPKTLEESNAFEPHSWVLAAIKTAYFRGRQDERWDGERNRG